MKFALSGHPLPDEKQSFVMGAVTGLFWFAQAVGCYLTVYLQGQGFVAAQLGILNALCSAMGILSVALWGMVSDKLGSLRGVYITVLVTGCFFYALVPLMPMGQPWSALLVTLYMGALTLFRGAQGTMAENILVRNCNELSLNFGALRSMGSIFYAVSSLGVAWFIDYIGVPNTFWLSGVCMIPVIFLVAVSREPDAAPAQKREKLNVGELFQSKPYVLLMVFASIFYLAVACGGNFIPFYMNAIGVSSRRYGVILGYRAFLEIPFLLLMVKLRRKFPLKTLVALGALLMGVESLGYGLFVHSLGGMLLFSTFFGLGNGLFIGSSLNYVYELAPAHLKASAQAFYTSVASVASIVGNLLGGVLFDALGPHLHYQLVAAMYALSVVVFAVASLERRPARHSLRLRPAHGPAGGKKLK